MGRGRPAGRGRQTQGASANTDSENVSQHRSASRARQTPEDLLDRHLANLDTNSIYQIPDASQNQLGPEDIFNASHLQSFGLLNDGNICSLVSLILCFHRIGIKDHLIDPHFCFNLDRTLDFPSLVFHKILSAMPSQNSFSLQLFIKSWNQSGKAPSIDVGCTY